MDINFNDLGLEVDDSYSTFEWNDQIVEVKEYLPIEQKLTIVNNIVNSSIDTNGYYNPAEIYINTIINIVLAYTNIKIENEDEITMAELYDKISSSGLSGKIIGEMMNPTEYSQIKAWVTEVINSVYNYKNSAVGIFDAIRQSYQDTEFNVKELVDTLRKNEDVKAVVTEVNDLLA